MVDTKNLKRRLDELKSSRAGIEGVWDEVERFVIPLSASARPNSSEGVQERQEVWDFTAIDGCQKFAASIHGSVTSPAIRWFRFGFRDGELQKDTDAQKWLDQVTEIVWADLQASDFNTEIASCYQEFVAFGNHAISVEARDEEKWKGLDFTAIPIREAYFEPGTVHDLVKFYRTRLWTPVEIVDKFKDAKRALPQEILEVAAKSADAAEKREVCFCVFRRDDVEERVKAPVAPELRPWGCVYFLADSGEQLGDEGGFYDQQVVVGRWEKTANSIWGHGPAITGLPTIRSLNAWCQITKRGAEKAVDPASLVTDRALLSTLDLRPGAFTVVRSVEDVKVHESGVKVDAGYQIILDDRQAVRRLFHVDELQLKDSPAMTATEVQVRYELMNRVMGSTLARLTKEVLDPLLTAVLGIEARAGRLPPAPPQVKAKGNEAAVQYQGPLSRAQRSDEVAAIERGGAMYAAFIKLGLEEVREVVDVDGMIRATFERLGVPAQLLRSEAEVKRMRAQRQAMQNRMAEAEIAKTQAEAAAKASQAGELPVPASPVPLVAPTIPGA